MSRYALDRSDKKRTPCPSCGHVGTYRPYVDTLTGEVLGLSGRCDRANNCNYHLTPRQHFESLGLGIHPPQKRAPLPPPRRTDWRCPENIVALTRQSRGNVFATWLISHLGDAAVQALRAYRVGTYPIDAAKHPELRGAMVYWQIGEDGKERSAKVIQYLPDGHRDKEVKPTWLHRLIHPDKSMEELGCSQVLFGAHLLPQRPDDPVAVIESEKSAVICSILYPSRVWVATGGAQGMALDKMMALAGRDVTFFPDQGMYHEWCAKVVNIEPMLRSCYVSDILEAIGADEGSDLADYLIPDRLTAMGIEIFQQSFVEQVTDTQEVAVSEPDVVDNSMPPVLRRMIDRNESLRNLVAELDLDVSKATIVQ